MLESTKAKLLIKYLLICLTNNTFDPLAPHSEFIIILNPTHTTQMNHKNRAFQMFHISHYTSPLKINILQL